jgi:hypothetical protein
VAPWAAGADGARRLLERGGLLAAATPSSPERRLRVREYRAAHELVAVLGEQTTAASARIVVFPSTLRATMADAAGDRLVEFAAVGPFLSTENPPSTLAEWLALVLPAAAAERVAAWALGDGGESPPVNAPSLLFAMLLPPLNATTATPLPPTTPPPP